MVAMDVDWIEAGAPTYQETDGKWVRVITVRKMGQWRVSLTQEMVSLYCCMIQADLMTSKVENTHTHTHTWKVGEIPAVYLTKLFTSEPKHGRRRQTSG